MQVYKRKDNKMKMNRRKFVKISSLGGSGILSLGIDFNQSKDAIMIEDMTKEKNVIIDSHCHAWSYWPYEPVIPDPESRGKIEQLIAQMDLWGVDRATVVSAQIKYNPSNNDYIADAVKRYPDRLYQYADVDSVWSDTYHTAGAAKRMEKAIERFTLKGFTHYLANDDNGEWLNTQEGIDFLRVADDAGLIASISCQPHHQPALRKVAERFPDMPILCHHMSHIKCSEKSPHKDLQEVLTSSQLPNIYLKFSGFAYMSDDNNKGEYPYTDTHWILKACYERYGRRMVWGSDYPVVNFYMTYQQSLEAFRRHCDFIEPSDKNWILGGTLQSILKETTI